MTAGVNNDVALDGLDAYELLEMLEFVADWLNASAEPCQEALDAFSPGYGVGELRAALISFSRLLDKAIR
jgi:hypothetical protein